MSNPLARLAPALLLSALMTLLPAPAAFAHASLVKAEPAPGSTLAEGPPRVTLWFAEPVEPGFSDIRVLDSAGNRVDNGDSAISGGDPKALSVSLRPLERGVYTVSWRNVSALDGHPLRDSFTFAIGQGSALEQGRPARPPLFQSPLEPLLRWLGLLGALALVGGFGFSLLVAAPALDGHKEVARRLIGQIHAVQWGAAAVLVVAELGRLLAQASILYEIPLYQTLGLPALGVIQETEWGHFWLWRILLVWATVAMMTMPEFALRGAVRRNTGRWLGLLAGAGVLATFSLASHGSALADLRVAGTITDFLHLLASAFWVGGLIHFLLGMSIFRALRPRERQGVLSALVPRFSIVASLSVGTLIITGLYSAWAMAGTLPAAYTQTPYGLSLVAKIALVVPLLVVAAVNLLWVKPRLSQATAGEWLRKLVLGEVILAVLTLLAVSFLTTLETARAVAAREGLGQEEAQLFHEVAGDKHISVRIDPGQVGSNSFVISMSDTGGNPVNNADVSLRLTYIEADLGAADLSAASSGDGEYMVDDTPLVIAGRWRLELTVRSRGSFDVRTAIPFEVATAATVRSGVVPPTTGELLFGVELLLLGFLFQGAGLRLGGWRSPAGVAAISLGTAAAIFGIFLMASLVGIGQRGAQASNNPFPADEQSLSIGKQLYTRDCLVCHGEFGTGDGPLAQSLNPRPLDLSVHVPFHPQAGLHRFIAKGIPGTSMVAWENNLAPEEIWHIVNYINTFVPVDR